MRYLLFACALMILGGMTWFFRSNPRLTGASDGVYAAAPSADEDPAQRGSPGLAGVSAGGDGAPRQGIAPTREVNAFDSDGPVSAPSRLHVRLVEKDREIDAVLFQSLRVRARSLLSGAEFEAPVTVPVRGAGLEATIEL